MTVIPLHPCAQKHLIHVPTSLSRSRHFYQFNLIFQFLPRKKIIQTRKDNTKTWKEKKFRRINWEAISVVSLNTRSTITNTPSAPKRCVIWYILVTLEERGFQLKKLYNFQEQLKKEVCKIMIIWWPMEYLLVIS